MRSGSALVFSLALFFFAWPPAVGSASAQSFTIAVIPDAQNYTDYRYQTTSKPPFFMDQAGIFYRQIAYVAANAASAGGNIVFTAFLGDLVNDYSTRASEWRIADAAVSKLDGVMPFGIVPGNHDYDFNRYDQKDKGVRVDGSILYNCYFGPESRHFEGRSWYGGSFADGRDSWSTFQAGGETFLFLGLELEPSDASLAWAGEVLDAHPGLPAILVTHEYLSCYDEPKEPGQAQLANHSYRKGMDRNTPRQLWDKFIGERSQIFLVLCGHFLTALRRERDRASIATTRVSRSMSFFPITRAELRSRLGTASSIFPGAAATVGCGSWTSTWRKSRFT
jgi:hypothetical protein